MENTLLPTEGLKGDILYRVTLHCTDMDPLRFLDTWDRDFYDIAPSSEQDPAGRPIVQLTYCQYGNMESADTVSRRLYELNGRHAEEMGFSVHLFEYRYPCDRALGND
mgnify:CR=1 FL=1